MSTDRREDSLYKHKYRELVKAIEDIKQEIPKLGLGIIGQNLVLECIDKHIRKEQE